jgi:hypothetical protein
MRILARGIAAALLAAAAAAGASSCHGGTCHANGDCSGGQSCVGPDPGPSCGIPPQHGCTSPTDCGGGEVCSVVLDPCSASGFGSQCQPPCASDMSCGTGLRCNAQSACEPIPCGQGVTCPSYQRCGPPTTSGPVWGFDDGCATISCILDSDCPAFGACIDGACQSGPGHCETPVEVP